VGEITRTFQSVWWVDEDEVVLPLGVKEELMNVRSDYLRPILAVQQSAVLLDDFRCSLPIINEDDLGGASAQRFESQTSAAGKQIENSGAAETQAILKNVED